MALTPSTMVPLGTRHPDFQVVDVATGETLAWEDVAGPKGTLILFICAHCPFVTHVEEGLVRLGKDSIPRGIGILGISSNDAQTHPGDGPKGLLAQSQRAKFPFPYGYDEDQSAAIPFQAACTPDLFLDEAEGRLAYRGQVDDSRPGNGIPVTCHERILAIDWLLAKELPPQ
ncbi:thioredoxin family protein, partial [bacterium]|nr:thioredoxin family protein [bacterium]